MRRQVTFELSEGNYVLKESDSVIFSINPEDLQFDSLEFYNGVYYNKNPEIDLSYKIASDPIKKGNYIFNWIREIIVQVEKDLGDEL